MTYFIFEGFHPVRLHAKYLGLCVYVHVGVLMGK